MKFPTITNIRIILIWLSLIIAYALLSDVLRDNQFFVTIFKNIQDKQPTVTYSVFILLLLAALLLPISSASLLVLIGVDLFGPDIAFSLSLFCGVIAAILSYFLGYFIPGFVKHKKFQLRFENSKKYVNANLKIIYLSTFLVRCIPNPLYDIWGYACGALKIRFWGYLLSSIIGGVIPIYFLCFII